MEKNRPLVAGPVVNQNSDGSGSSVIPHITIQQPTVSTVKLPKLGLPTFDGSIENRHSFRNKFMSRIHNNNNLSAVNKLQYLENSLAGKAKHAIESLENTEDNNKEAWDILDKIYNNSRKAILRHWSILHDMLSISKGSSRSLDDLTDAFWQQLRALKSLGELIEHWNTCVICLILSKISENMRYQWETTLQDNKMPEYESLIRFIEKRGSCTDSSVDRTTTDENVKNNYNLRPSKNQFNSRPHALVARENYNDSNRNNNNNHNHISSNNNGYHFKNNGNNHVNNMTNSYPPCSICQGKHSIYKCYAFRDMSIIERKKAVDNARLCHNCLWEKYGPEGCKGVTCRLCSGEHYTFPHPGSGNNRQLPAQANGSIFNNSKNTSA